MKTVGVIEYQHNDDRNTDKRNQCLQNSDGLMQIN